ncbi:MAG: hypothetical protein KatS3mg125_0158 [Lysobacterales bacterium]|jgi:hypothetical protein|nr:MAG: hypothetical protein KatS3mg125_0158 [Xanthomonadales bacterium]
MPVMLSSLLGVLLAVSAASLAQSQFSSLEERMSEAEFRAAGLHKLSPEELAALNAWLKARLGGIPETPAASLAPEDDRIGFPARTDRRVIVSRIDGELNGWGQDPLRKTRFKLQNGQVWEQVDTSRGDLKLVDPVVTIEPAALGSWLMRIEDYNQRIRVRRIQ